MSDLPVIQSSARTYIFVDALSAALGKMTTCLFFLFPELELFPPILLRHGGVGGRGHYFHSNAHLLPFQWCVTLFYSISFVHFSSPLFTVIYGNKSDVYLGRRRGATASARTHTAAVQLPRTDLARFLSLLERRLALSVRHLPIFERLIKQSVDCFISFFLWCNAASAPPTNNHSVWHCD